jgi:hypothetical protein
MTRTRLHAEPLEDRTTPVTLPNGFAESVFASGLTNPTQMAVAPDGRVGSSAKGSRIAAVAAADCSAQADRSGRRRRVQVSS